MLTSALCFALAFAPSALHAHICLVELGAIESSDCCTAVSSCCSQRQSDGPVVNASEADCHCCLELNLDAEDKVELAGAPSSGAQHTLPPAISIALLPRLMPAPALESARLIFARAGPRLRSAAPVPLRI